MSRLHEISCNKKQWSIKGNRDIGRYNLINKKDLTLYRIPGDIIGIEQINDDEFLVYRIISCDEWEPGNKYQIARVKLKDSKIILMYYYDFYHNFHFLTEDIIIFDDSFLLYSISENKEDDRLKHLFSEDKSLYDCRLVKDSSISFLYDNKKDLYPNYLLIEYKLNSGLFDIAAYLQVVIDVNSFLPVMPVYSTLRPGELYLAPSQTLGQLVEKETHYANIVGNFLFDFYHKKDKKNADELLAMIKKTE